MATFPVATGARLLGIHPKTLHHWLKAAEFPLAAHPTDARLKCVAEEHLLEVARRHGRPLPDLTDAPRLDGRSAPGSREEQTKPPSAHEAELDHSTASMSAHSTSEADLIQRLSCLETKIVTFQEHLAQLALALLQERERTVEQRIAALESLMQPLVGGHLLRVASGAGFAAVVCMAGEHLLVPLCGPAGAFHRLSPRSPLALLESPSRHPSAPLQADGWRVTDQLTIQRLEQVAATLQSHMASL